MPEISESLRVAYCNARYEVDADDEPLALRIGIASAGLAALLAACGATTAAIITAHNPASRIAAAADNARAHAALTNVMQRGGYAIRASRGIDPSGHFPDEPGLLILGITLAAARKLARRFRQAALVWIEEDATPRLVWLDTTD